MVEVVVLFAVLTFLIVFSTIVGAYWAFVVYPEDHAQASLRRRLKSGLQKRAKKLAVVKDIGRLSDVPLLDAVLARASRLSTPLQHQIDESGLNLTVGLFVLGSGCLGLLVYLVIATVSRSALLGLVAAAVAASLPTIYLGHARRQRLKTFEEQFPEAIDLIARALRAGHAFATGLGMAADELQDPIGSEFRLLYDRQNYGMALPDALRAFAARVPLLDARFFVTAVLTQRESGGNLSEVLDNLSSVIRERFRVKRQVRVASAHGRITAYVLVALPPALALVFFLTAPESMSVLLTDPLGIRMVVLATTLQIVGTIIVRRMVDIEY